MAEGVLRPLANNQPIDSTTQAMLDLLCPKHVGHIPYISGDTARMYLPGDRKSPDYEMKCI